MNPAKPASDEHGVAALYQDTTVAEAYIQRRFAQSWSYMLHRSQVAEINGVIKRYQPNYVVELAPGPARIAPELAGVRRGLMIENSEQMVALARQRLAAAGLDNTWELRRQNAFAVDAAALQCDLLYTFRFIRHFHEEERVRLYHLAYSALKPEGLLMFDVVNRAVRQRLDTKEGDCPKDELNVYDVTYSPTDFRREMERQGFSVVSLRPVLQHFELQTWISYTFDHRWRTMADVAVRFLEKWPSHEPLEWVALCRKVV